MKYYFRTTCKAIGRTLRHNGIPPWLGILLFLLVMTVLTMFANRYPEYAPYFVIYFALSGLLSIASTARVSFLKQHFGVKKTLQIRWIESFVVTLPWLYIALLSTNWYLLLFLLLLVFSSAFITPKRNQRSLPTPFPKSPFELTVFFRRSFVYVLGVAITLTGIACYFGNFNLGLVCFGFVLLVGCSAQDYREPEFFVWSYTRSPSRFLRLKVWRATSQMALLVSPIIVLLITVFPAQFLLVFLCLLLGLLLHVVYVLLKYAIYPRIFAVPDLIVLMIGLALPVILPFIVYRYYQKAKTNLLTWL